MPPCSCRQMPSALCASLHTHPIPCRPAVPPAADGATGQARQVVADEHYLIPNETLGQAYRRCAHVRPGCMAWQLECCCRFCRLACCCHGPSVFLEGVAPNFTPCTRPCLSIHPPLAQAGHTRREKRKPYKHLRTPWGETFTFSTDSRQVGGSDFAAPAAGWHCVRHPLIQPQMQLPFSVSKKAAPPGFLRAACPPATEWRLLSTIAPCSLTHHLLPSASASLGPHWSASTG